MQKPLRRLVATLACWPGLALAQEPGGAVPVAEDLAAVLTLRGKPCGKVVSYERLGESDFEVVCSDGHRYRVFIGKADRVKIEER